MSIDFPLILVLGTLITGLIWLIDILFLRKKREQFAADIPEDVAVEAKTELRVPLVVEYSISFFPVLLIVLVLRSFLFEPFQIPTGSMIPTLKVGDFILVNKYVYGLRLPVTGNLILSVDDPKNGEVMVFIPPHEDEYFIKRVVGIPGDIVRYENKQLYINEEQQPLEFIEQVPPLNPKYLVYNEELGEVEHLIHRNPFKDARVLEWEIPEGYYFMMGDNRDHSSDSRYWGLVSEENIVGKAVAVWMHKDPGWKLPVFSQNRWIQ